MKCNYKNHVPVKETILELKDQTHFNKFGVKFIIGEYYPDFVNHHDATTLSLNFGGLALIETLYQPTATEIMNFRFGNLKFALAEDKDSNILFFLSKFGNNCWGSSCMNYSLNVEPYELDDNITIIPMLLFDTSNGQLIALRSISVDKSFINKVNVGIRKQLTKNYSIEEFSRTVTSFYKKYPSDNDLLKDAYYVYSTDSN